jgi:hypothetical protein
MGAGDGVISGIIFVAKYAAAASFNAEYGAPTGLIPAEPILENQDGSFFAHVFAIDLAVVSLGVIIGCRLLPAAELAAKESQ